MKRLNFGSANIFPIVIAKPMRKFYLVVSGQ